VKIPKRLVSIAIGLLLSVGGCVQIGKNGPERVRLKEPRIKPLVESEWTEEQAKILNASRVSGKLLNVSLTMAHNPRLLERLNAFTRYVLRESTLPERDREILILRIGWLCRSEYEFGQHTRIGLWVGLSAEDIERITKGPDAPGWTPFETTLLKAVDELHADAFITDGTWKALAEVYNEKQLLDLVMTVGQYNLVSMLLNSTGVQLEAGLAGFPGRDSMSLSPDRN